MEYLDFLRSKIKPFRAIKLGRRGKATELNPESFRDLAGFVWAVIDQVWFSGAKVEGRGVMWVVVLAFVVFLILLFGPMVW